MRFFVIFLSKSYFSRIYIRKRTSLTYTIIFFIRFNMKNKLLGIITIITALEPVRPIRAF